MSRVCACGCGRSLDGRPARARFFESKCRSAAFRARRDVVGFSGASTATVDMVRAELLAADRVDTYLGAAALALAERIDNATAVMGFAALVRELRVTMEGALEGVGHDRDALTDIRSSAALKLIRSA